MRNTECVPALYLNVVKIMYVRGRVLVAVNTVDARIQIIIELGTRSDGHTIDDDIKSLVRPVDIIVFDVYKFIRRGIYVVRCGITV